MNARLQVVATGRFVETYILCHIINIIIKRQFQWYDNDRTNSYVDNGFYHIRPTFTSDIFGEAFLTSGRAIIPPDQCTQSEWYGCDRQGTPTNIINPIRSARIDTWNSFHFKYGTLEIRAKMPAGDFLWPALWLMPRFSVYGGWPASGEIDLMELRGNRNLFSGATHVGNQQAGSTMHFGPRSDVRFEKHKFIIMTDH